MGRGCSCSSYGTAGEVRISVVVYSYWYTINRGNIFAKVTLVLSDLKPPRKAAPRSPPLQCKSSLASMRRAASSGLRTRGAGWSRAFSQRRVLAQPAPESHPHIMAAGEVTPGLAASEYAGRCAESGTCRCTYTW